MKLTTNDALAVLRQFGEAGQSHKVKDIVNFKVAHPIPSNTVATFLFHRIPYALVLDEMAEDDASYLITQTDAASPFTQFQPLLSPVADIMTYGLPYKQKEIYLMKSVSTSQRLDIRLAEDYPEYSRSSWQKFIRLGYISVNGKSVISPKTDVEVTDTISVEIPAKTDYSTEELPILYIDDDVIVVNKPAGMLTHGKGELNDEFTVADFFRRYTNNALDTNRPGIVHRLDRDTSGVIIGARTDAAAVSLQKQFAGRHAHKTYLAITDDTPKLSSARIDIPIGRNPNDPGSFRVDSKGKSAVTDYTVVAEHDGRALITLQPATGRTHQLRVHLQHLGTPIVGDRLYGKSADRMYLHALRLQLTLPSGRDGDFRADIPTDFITQFPEAASL
jgi:23S rRNA pseudouridine1911/1915/1917 synthase